jgi:cytochrome c-type biogenesis protein CcmH/NrfF
VTRALLAALLALALLPAAAVGAQPRTTLPDVEDEVMCVECGTALNVSQSPVADQERDLIRRRIAAGDTKEQIKAALVDEYGRDVLASPEGSGIGIAAWWLPIALVPLGLLAVLLAWRRWRASSVAAGTGATEDGAAPLDPDDARRLDAELAAFDR